MLEDDIPEVIQRYWRAVASRDADAVVDLVTSDFVEEWPQSGERVVGAAAWAAVVREHPTYPQATLRRAVGCNDVWTCEADFAYPGGSDPWKVCSIIELGGDRIARITQYFGAPFPAADWRASIVERT